METETARQSPISKAHSRHVKLSLVLGEARRHRVVSRAQLAELTGLSPSTVTHIVRELLADGYFTEIGAGRSRGGRPMSMLEFNPAADLVAVVDVRADRVVGSLADWDGTVQHTRTGDVTGGLVDAVVGLIEELDRERPGRLRAVCVAIPGVASGSGGQVSLAPDIADVDGQPLGEMMQQRTGYPVVVDNDVNLIAVGEHAAGAAVGSDDVLLVHVGETGVGAAVLLGGTLWHGRSGVAGEIGFLPLETGDLPEGGVGPFERRWSGRAIAGRAAALGLHSTADRLIADIEAVAETDNGFAELLEAILTAWCRAIVAVVCVLDPGRVLLSGLAADLSDAALDRLRRAVTARAPGATQISRTGLGPAALHHGAVRRAFDAHDSLTSSN